MKRKLKVRTMKWHFPTSNESSDGLCLYGCYFAQWPYGRCLLDFLFWNKGHGHPYSDPPL